MIQSNIQLSQVHKQVIKYLKLKLPANQNVCLDVNSVCFYQEELNGNHYRATIMLNGTECHVVLIDIPDILMSSQVEFTVLKEIEIQKNEGEY